MKVGRRDGLGKDGKMERFFRRLLFVTIGYTLGWFLAGWQFFAACLVASVITSVLHLRGIIPDHRLEVLKTLSPDARREAERAGLKAAIPYGFCYFVLLGCFAGWVRAMLAH